MKFYWLVLGVLAVWRITSLLGFEDGPWDAFARLRSSAGDGLLGKALGCFYCLSLWVSIPFGLMIGETWTECLLLWLAMSAGAIAFHRFTQSGYDESPAVYFEDEEK